MKTLIAALAVASTVVAVASAQNASRGGASALADQEGKQAFAPDEVFIEAPQKDQSRRGEKPFPGALAVKSAPIDQNKAAVKPQPIEALLLTKDAGPFMVLAKTFRGPDAERYAVALVQELRTEFALPAYILRLRDFRNRGVARDAAPAAPAGRAEANAGNPKKNRAFEECAVLVGDEKTLEASEKLLHRVKSLKPACLDALPHIWNNRRRLKNAIRTTNPFVPAADLFSRK